VLAWGVIGARIVRGASITAWVIGVLIVVLRRGSMKVGRLPEERGCTRYSRCRRRKDKNITSTDTLDEVRGKDVPMRRGSTRVEAKEFTDGTGRQVELKAVSDRRPILSTT
jgi:hypothetical protein